MIWYGHTISNGHDEIFTPGVDFCGGILSLPMLIEDEARSLAVSPEKTIRFWSFIPLYAPEMRFARANGSDALFEKLDEAGVNELVQVGRPPVV